MGAAALVLFAVAFHRSRGRLASYRAEANALVATDADGREIWRKTFSEPLNLEAYTPQIGTERARVEDADNDGQTELLWVHMSAGTQPQAVRGLVCYSERGDELWRYVPGKRVSSRVEPFEPPFYTYNFVVGPAGNLHGKSIVVASSHSYYPTQVAVLDSLGHVGGEYWHSGHFQVSQLMDLSRERVQHRHRCRARRRQPGRSVGRGECRLPASGLSARAGGGAASLPRTCMCTRGCAARGAWTTTGAGMRSGNC